MTIGDIQTFRDWSHVEDIVKGYIIMAEKAEGGSLYVQGSMRTHSVLSYILYTLSELGYEIDAIHTFKDKKSLKDPLLEKTVTVGDYRFSSNVLDEQLLSGTMNFDLSDGGLIVKTDKREFKVEFDESRFRPSEVPVLLSNTEKIKKELGSVCSKQIRDIINDQINYYFDRDRRLNVI
jgi:GDPmannose 4,6-dehydratase